MITELDEAIKHCKEVAKEKRIEEQEWRDRREFIESNERNPKGIYDLPINQCKECAKDHEQLAAWLTELTERREADRWIPVSERLPEESLNSVIGWDAYRERCVFVQYVDGHFQITGSDESFNIVAWKPLPKPYEREDK